MQATGRENVSRSSSHWLKSRKVNKRPTSCQRDLLTTTRVFMELAGDPVTLSLNDVVLVQQGQEGCRLPAEKT